LTGNLDAAIAKGLAVTPKPISAATAKHTSLEPRRQVMLEPALR